MLSSLGDAPGTGTSSRESAIRSLLLPRVVLPVLLLLQRRPLLELRRVDVVPVLRPGAERVNKREGGGGGVNEWVNERVNEWVNERVNERLNEWVNERVNERL